MKKNYEKPSIEIEEFEVEDILTLNNSSQLGTAPSLLWDEINDIK